MTDETPVSWRDWMRGALKSRTFVFNVLTAIVAGISANLAAVQPYMTPQNFALFATAVAVVNLVLRAITTTPLPHK